MLVVTLRWTSIPSRGSRNTPCHLMRDVLRPDGPLGSNAEQKGTEELLEKPDKMNAWAGERRWGMGNWR